MSEEIQEQYKAFSYDDLEYFCTLYGVDENKSRRIVYQYCKKFGIIGGYILYNIWNMSPELYDIIKENIKESDTVSLNHFMSYIADIVTDLYETMGFIKVYDTLEEKAQDYYDMWQKTEKSVFTVVETCPKPDVETKMANGENTSEEMDEEKLQGELGAVDVVATKAPSADTSSDTSSNNTSASVSSVVAETASGAMNIASSSVGLAGAAISGTAGVVGSAVNLAASGVGDALAVAGVAIQLGELVISESSSYIAEAGAKILLASTTYAAKLVIDTPKKTVSYMMDMVKNATPSVSDFLTPISVKQDLEKEAAKAAAKAAKLAEVNEKVNNATKKVTSKLSEVQDKITYITTLASEGPDKLQKMGTEMLQSALSYVGDVRDKTIKIIADWEEKASNELSYNIAIRQSQETILKLEKTMKKAADEINKLKAKAEIIAKKATAVAISKVAALLGI